MKRAKPTINRFLFCLSLETGGFVMGWISAMVSFAAIVLFLFFGITVMIDLNRDDNVTNQEQLFYNVLYGVAFGMYFIYSSILLYASIQLIRGTKNKNHFKLRLYILLMIIGLGFSILQLCYTTFNYHFAISDGTFIGSVISLIIGIYFFICIYSLYEKLKIDRRNLQLHYPIQQQMQPTVITMVMPAQQEKY